MLEALMAIVTGGATGLLGTLLSSATGYFERKQRHRHELKLRELDAKIVETEAASAERVAAIAAESHQSAAESRALQASYDAAGVRWSTGDSAWLVAVDVIRGLIRPVLTVGFVALCGVIYFTLPRWSQGDVEARIIDTALYLMTTTVLWWFGTRPKKQAG